MKKTAFLVLILCVAFLQPLFACKCEEAPALSKEVIKRYDAIFTGKVIAVTEGGRASFSIDTLFAGKLPKQVELSYDVLTSCAMSFAPGETWTIYGRWGEFGVVHVELCSHTRKLPVGDDYYISELRPGYFSETQWLKENIGPIEFSNPAEHNDQLHRNELPGPATAIGYLIAGLGGLGIIFFFVRRMFRRDGK
jgi:hypothetical protein